MYTADGKQNFLLSHGIFYINLRKEQDAPIIPVGILQHDDKKGNSNEKHGWRLGKAWEDTAILHCSSGLWNTKS